MSLDPTTAAHSVEDEALLVIDDDTTPSGRNEDGRVTYEVYNSGPNTCYLGGSGVTTSSGVPLPSGSSRSLSVRHFAKLYAICAANNTADVRVLMVP
jgi:hypothetical protein